MKKILKSILVIVMFLCITTACNKNENNKDNKEITDSIRFKEEYESLNGTIREKDGKTIRSISITENNPMIYKTAEELVNMINNKETFMVYFGFKDCPWCRSMLPTLIEVANDLNLEKIYYVDVKEIRDTLSLSADDKIIVDNEGSEGYKQLLDLLDNVLDDYILTNSKGKKINTKEKRIFAPNIVAIKDGKAKALEEGISENQKDGYAELTDDIKKEMYEKIENIIKEIATN